MDAGVLDDHVHDARVWSRPRREPESDDTRAAAAVHEHHGADSAATKASFIVIGRRADDHGKSGSFQSQMADAMRAAARSQHSHIVSDVEERQAAYVSALHNRAAADVDAMRQSADGVTEDVEAWAAAELERIESERGQKIDTARMGFQQRLESHESQVAQEIADVRDRVNAYRAEIDAFFSRLDAESDPARIAEMAAQVPVLPDLEGASAAARARATVEVAPSQPPEPVASVAEIPELPVAGSPDAAGDGDQVTEAVTEAASATSGWDTESLGDQEPVGESTPLMTAEEQPHGQPEAPLALAEDDGADLPAAPTVTLPALNEREAEPAASVSKPKDLIRERLRYIAERRAALTDLGAATWSGEPTSTSRPA